MPRRIRNAILVASLTTVLLPAQQQLRLEPPHDSGQSVTPAFEGWFANADGTYSILYGYFNRNMKQELDIPIGPDNKIEPAGPDRGQPTHFLTRRQWGIFTVTVPKDFGSQKVSWTISTNGVTTVIPAIRYGSSRPSRTPVAILRRSSDSATRDRSRKVPARKAKHYLRQLARRCRCLSG